MPGGRSLEIEGLQKITHRHEDIIRRLICGQTQKSISLECGITSTRLSVLKRDPLFKQRYEEMQVELQEKFLDVKSRDLVRLDETSELAAELVANVVKGQVDGENVPLKMRIDSAFDVLDRTVTKKTEVTAGNNMNIGNLVIQAYQQKYGDDKRIEVV